MFVIGLGFCPARIFRHDCRAPHASPITCVLCRTCPARFRPRKIFFYNFAPIAGDIDPASPPNLNVAFIVLRAGTFDLHSRFYSPNNHSSLRRKSLSSRQNSRRKLDRTGLISVPRENLKTPRASRETRTEKCTERRVILTENSIIMKINFVISSR